MENDDYPRSGFLISQSFVDEMIAHIERLDAQLARALQLLEEAKREPKGR